MRFSSLVVKAFASGIHIKELVKAIEIETTHKNNLFIITPFLFILALGPRKGIERYGKKNRLAPCRYRWLAANCHMKSSFLLEN
jgi:uncharacterized membrane protein